MAFLEGQFPMEIKISFNKLVRQYQTHLNGDNELLEKRAKRILSIVKDYPSLILSLIHI